MSSWYLVNTAVKAGNWNCCFPLCLHKSAPEPRSWASGPVHVSRSITPRRVRAASEQVEDLGGSRHSEVPMVQPWTHRRTPPQETILAKKHLLVAVVQLPLTRGKWAPCRLPLTGLLPGLWQPSAAERWCLQGSPLPSCSPCPPHGPPPSSRRLSGPLRVSCPTLSLWTRRPEPPWRLSGRLCKPPGRVQLWMGAIMWWRPVQQDSQV